MTPFRRRPHLRIAGMSQDVEITDGEVVPDPNAPQPPPPPPRTVEATADELQPDSPPLASPPSPKAGLFDDPAKLVVQGLFVGIGYGFASKVMEMIFEPSKAHRSSGLAGTTKRRRKKHKRPALPPPG